MRSRLAAGLVLALLAPAVAGGGPAETVVLVNTASADSRKVAEHYAKKRNIPAQQVCEVTCAATLATSMDEFVRDVVDPLRRFLHERGIEDRCRFVVLTQGMPILARTPGGAVSTTAALSLLDTAVCGQPQTPLPTWKHAYTQGPVGTPVQIVDGRLLLATALVSTTADEAIALVDRSVASDGTAPQGARFVFQDANGAAGVRNPHYDDARRELEALGFATEHEKSGADAVKGRKSVMGYMSGGSYSGLTSDGVATDEYLPGAICDMLQSFGAVPGNFDADASKHSQFPVTHMIRAGVTGVHGAVAEPYNITFPDAKLFQPYALGFTLAEAFHQRLPYVYWMNLTIGDPLCAPYARRPAPTMKADGRWEGAVHVTLSAPGAVRIDVYADGRRVGSVAGATGALDVDTTNWANGPHDLLVEATGEGEAEPRGWLATTVTSKNTPATVGRAADRLRCGRVLVEAPSSVRAGEAAVLKVAVVRDDGGPLPRWTGRFEVRTSSPPVRWAVVDSSSPDAEIPLTFTRATDYDLRVVAVDDGAEAAARVHVAPSDFDHATTPASRLPLCQETDLQVDLLDRFDNRVRDWEGTIAVDVPQDPLARIPVAVDVTPADGGRCVLRGLLVTRPGQTALVFKDARGRVVSRQGEGATVAKSAIGTWLVAGPIPAKALGSSDPTVSVVGDGAVAAKALFRRRAGGDPVALPAGDAKGGDAALLVTWIESIGETKALLLGAARGRLRVLLDGKQLFDGTLKGADPQGRRELVAEVKFAPGVHRLAVVAEAKAGASASLEILDGANELPATLRFRASSGERPRTFVVSGRVRDGGSGKGGVRGATVTVVGADGRERTATSAADGTWWVENVPPGETVVKFAATERKLMLRDANAVDVDL